MMTKKHNILILSAGRRVELVQAFRKALLRHIVEARVFTTDLHPGLSAACLVSDHGFKAPRVTAPEYIDYLLELCLEQKVGMVMPTIDIELNILALNRERFEAEGIHLVISNYELVAACRDKRKTAETYSKLKIEQPTIYSKNNLQFPCFCKPYDGSGSIGALALYTPDMLSQELLEDEKNMFMELISNEYSEYTVDAYYDRSSKLCCLVPRERIEVREGEVSKGATRKNYVYKYLRCRLERLEGARGCITVQVFANPEDESIKALEINPRFGGGFPLTHAAGANYPDWLIREYFLNECIDFYDGWESNMLMLRYDAKVIVHEN
ncbi:ATP-grasp domain-containing protein [Oceanisphaera arctica]|uniref:Carbamoyl phosphate synthase large subunit n=1 Tax=Oceanisphaera arctica TaxID=641510 RepID=A0A2P5TI36_9GAMM|nr:ATP-grasp domain-containing protein [Oceanisphaera arctica]PPL14273.1 carbamoyl phosphate synthase large subunit [Oceanisphaera arctica]GHA27827.1 carbamoyl phosphate synthase large subunit [Oceanisphaera arctica]